MNTAGVILSDGAGLTHNLDTGGSMSDYHPKRITVWVQRFKDRPTLMLQWIDPLTGKRKSKSAETNIPGVAEMRRTELEYELNHGLYQEASKLDWEAFRTLFEDEYLAGLRPRSREKYTTVLDVFEQIINPAKLGNFTERTVSLFVKGMRERKQRKLGKVGLEPITIDNYLIALKTALGWAVEQQLLPKLPKFPAIKVPRRSPSPWPPSRSNACWRKHPMTCGAPFSCAAGGPASASPMALPLHFEASDRYPWIDFDGNRLVLPAVFAKSVEDQAVPIHPTLRTALEALPRGAGRVFRFPSERKGQFLAWRTVSHKIKDFAKQAGVKLTMHKLRKGFGCRVAKQLGKGNPPILHELMRHSSMQITMDYYASVDDALQDAINQLT
jgi:integrase